MNIQTIVNKYAPQGSESSNTTIENAFNEFISNPSIQELIELQILSEDKILNSIGRMSSNLEVLSESLKLQVISNSHIFAFDLIFNILLQGQLLNFMRDSMICFDRLAELITDAASEKIDIIARIDKKSAQEIHNYYFFVLSDIITTTVLKVNSYVLKDDIAGLSEASITRSRNN